MSIALVNQISRAAIDEHFASVGRQAKERHAQEICGPALVIVGFGLFLTLATLIPA
jgi:hypothetical protein